MNIKTKSILYFTSFVIAFAVYSNMERANEAHQNELADNSIEQVSTQEALN